MITIQCKAHPAKKWEMNGNPSCDYGCPSVQRVIIQQEWSLDHGLAQWTLIQAGTLLFCLQLQTCHRFMITCVVFVAVSLYLISGNNLLLREGKF